MKKKLSKFYEGIAALATLNALSKHVNNKLREIAQKETDESFEKAKKSFRYWCNHYPPYSNGKSFFNPIHMRFTEDVINNEICKDIVSSYPFSLSEVKRIYERSKHDRKYTELILKTATEFGQSPDEVMDNSEAACKAFVEVGKCGFTPEETEKAISTLKSKDMKVQAPEGYTFKNGKTEKKVVPIETPKFICGDVDIERIDTSTHEHRQECVTLNINLYGSGNTTKIPSKHIISEVMNRLEEIE